MTDGRIVSRRLLEVRILQIGETLLDPASGLRPVFGGHLGPPPPITSPRLQRSRQLGDAIIRQDLLDLRGPIGLDPQRRQADNRLSRNHWIGIGLQLQQGLFGRRRFSQFLLGLRQTQQGPITQRRFRIFPHHSLQILTRSRQGS